MPPIRTPKRTITAFFSLLARPAAVDHTSRPRVDNAEPPAVDQSSPPSIDQPSPPTVDPVSHFSKLLPPSLAASGPKEVAFSSKMDWEKRAQRLNNSIKSIIFMGSFGLNDQHINDMVTLGTRVWRQLTHFTIYYHDVSRGSTESATEVTDQGIIQLAKLCPNLRDVQLQGTRDISDAALVALFRYCPHLTTLELGISARCNGALSSVTGSALDQLRQTPQWATKLKTCRFVSKNERGPFMKAMRALGRARPKITIYMGSVCEYRKWGDWELEVNFLKYSKGRHTMW